MPQIDTMPGDARAIIETMRELHAPSVLTIEDDLGHERQLLAAPRGVEIKSVKPFLMEYADAPERRKGTATLGDLLPRTTVD